MERDDMEKQSSRAAWIWITIAGLIIAGVIGYLIGLATPRPPGNSSVNGQSSNGQISNQNLRPNLVLVFGEHAALTTSALEASAKDDEPGANAAFKQLDDNSVAIAEQVNALYDGTRDEFLELWRNHIDYYNQYLAAATARNTDAMNQAKEQLRQFATDASNFFASRSPQVNQDLLRQQFDMHGNQVTMIIDALVANDPQTVYALSHDAYLHMGDIAITIANAQNQ